MILKRHVTALRKKRQVVGSTFELRKLPQSVFGASQQALWRRPPLTRYTRHTSDSTHQTALMPLSTTLPHPFCGLCLANQCERAVRKPIETSTALCSENIVKVPQPARKVLDQVCTPCYRAVFFEQLRLMISGEWYERVDAMAEDGLYLHKRHIRGDHGKMLEQAGTVLQHVVVYLKSGEKVPARPAANAWRTLAQCAPCSWQSGETRADMTCRRWRWTLALWARLM